MKIRELVRDQNPVTLQADDIVGLALQALDWSHARYLPVVRKGRVVGLVSEDELLAHHVRRGREGRQDAVSTVMVKSPVTVEGDLDVRAAAALVVEQELSCLPVLADGRLVGLVTRGELLRCFRREPASALAAIDLFRSLSN